MKFVTCACLLVLSAIPSVGKAHHKRHANAITPFDSYLLALSWSPEFCSGHPSDPQCTGSKHFGFVVHGLWPEYKTGSGPQNCSTQPGLTDPSKMLDIMPTLRLIDHEWKTHGSCSGLNADGYFALIRNAYNSIKIPAKFVSPTSQIVESPGQVKKDFESANKNLTDNELMVTCPGNYLEGIEVCLTKSLTPMACTAPKECRASTIRIPPLQ